MSEGEVGRPRRRRSRAEVEQLIVEYEASGLSRVEFCQKHGLALSTLARYQRRRAQGQDEGPGPSRWLAVELSGAHPRPGEVAHRPRQDRPAPRRAWVDRG